MRFETQLAWRHLTNNRGQTGLTVSAVAVAVVAIIFIQTLIFGIENFLTSEFVGSIPHVTIKPPDNDPVTLKPQQIKLTLENEIGNMPLVTRVQKRANQKASIVEWQPLLAKARQFPQITTVAALVLGNGNVVRGTKRVGINVTGGDPADLEKVYNIQRNVVVGKLQSLGADEVFIGWRLAEEVGVALGEQLRLESGTRSESYRVAGIFCVGNNVADLGQVYMSMRTAQSLLGLRRDVSQIVMKISDPFQATEVAMSLAAVMPNQKLDDWIRQDNTLLSILQIQRALRGAVSLLALLASSFAVASVLIVSVIQKQKQIGILKSMGAKNRQILRVFTIEALLIGLLGSVIGSVLVSGFLFALSKIPNPPGSVPYARETKLFAIEWIPSVFLGACGIATLATVISAVLPARRAARMNPVDVIRGG